MMKCKNCGRPQTFLARAGRPERSSHPAPKSNRFPACDLFVPNPEPLTRPFRPVTMVSRSLGGEVVTRSVKTPTPRREKT